MIEIIGEKGKISNSSGMFQIIDISLFAQNIADKTAHTISHTLYETVQYSLYESIRFFMDKEVLQSK